MWIDAVATQCWVSQVDTGLVSLRCDVISTCCMGVVSSTTGASCAPNILRYWAWMLRVLAPVSMSQRGMLTVVPMPIALQHTCAHDTRNQAFVPPFRIITRLACSTALGSRLLLLCSLALERQSADPPCCAPIAFCKVIFSELGEGAWITKGERV